MRSILLLAAATAVLALPASAPAQNMMHNPGHHPGWNQNWHIIGFKVVNGSSDKDTINLPGKQRYRQLKLCAYNAPLHLRDFDVQFANGGHQDVNTRARVNPGTCTRAIDLDGRNRDLARVVLKYDRIQRGMRAPLVRVTAR